MNKITQTVLQGSTAAPKKTNSDAELRSREGEASQATGFRHAPGTGSAAQGPNSKPRAQGQNLNAPATRQDLLLLNRRMVENLATLGKGLSETAEKSAAAERASVERRLDEMSRAVDSIDGALRIELGPQLQAMIESSVGTKAGSGSASWRKYLWWAVLVCGGIAAGTAFAPEILGLVNQFTSVLGGWLSAG